MPEVGRRCLWHKPLHGSSGAMPGPGQYRDQGAVWLQKPRCPFQSPNADRISISRSLTTRLASPRSRDTSRISALHWPCFQPARRDRSNPSGVRGPVLLPPCSLHRPLGIAGPAQGHPARVRDPHRGAARAAARPAACWCFMAGASPSCPGAASLGGHRSRPPVRPAARQLAAGR